MNIIPIDIETIPGQDTWVKEHVTKELSAPANYKDADKIAAYIAEKQDEAYRKTSFDGACNHIICISAALNDEEPTTFYADNINKEKNVLIGFYSWLQINLGDKFDRVLVGHNINGFDLKVLRHRSIILGIRPPDWLPFDAKPWDKSPYDTMVQWDGKNFVGLDKLCKALNIPGKDGMDGSMVYDAWLAGEHDKIKEYCADDVRRVRAIYKRMTFQQ